MHLTLILTSQLIKMPLVLCRLVFLQSLHEHHHTTLIASQVPADLNVWSDSTQESSNHSCHQACLFHKPSARNSNPHNSQVDKIPQLEHNPHSPFTEPHQPATSSCISWNSHPQAQLCGMCYADPTQAPVELLNSSKLQRKDKPCSSLTILR